MTAKHTPGPWSVKNNILLENQMRIEPAVGVAFGIGEQLQANANLIAAAPELLQALQELFGADMERVLLGDGKDDQIAAIAKAHEAIAKATGETQ